MSVAACVLLALLTIMTMGLVIGAAIMERRAAEMKWIHPPEDDDGVSLLEDEEDANH